MTDSSCEEISVPSRYQSDLENKSQDLELFYQVLLKIFTRQTINFSRTKTTLLKSDRAKVENGEAVLIKIRGPFKNIYKAINYIKALCGQGPAEVGLLYDSHLIPVWNAFHGFFLKFLEFDTCLPIVSLTDCGMTVRPCSENILDRFVNRLEELSKICEKPPIYCHKNQMSTECQNVLTDSAQINQRFFELLDRCAEPVNNRSKLMAINDRAKDYMMKMIKESGNAFQPTLIRRMSWKEHEEENKFVSENLDNSALLDHHVDQTDTGRLPMKRRFLNYMESVSHSGQRQRQNPKLEYLEREQSGYDPFKAQLEFAYREQESERTSYEIKKSVPKPKNSRDTRPQKFPELPIARTIPGNSYIKSTSFKNLDLHLARHRVKSGQSTKSSLNDNDNQDLDEEIIIISDEDEMSDGMINSNNSNSNCKKLSQLISKEEFQEPNYYMPNEDSMTTWFKNTFRPSPLESDIIYKTDMLNYFIKCFNLDSNQFISTSFYQFVKQFLELNTGSYGYGRVVQRGNTGTRSRKRYVHLKTFDNLKPPFEVSTGTPIIKRKSEINNNHNNSNSSSSGNFNTQYLSTPVINRRHSAFGTVPEIRDSGMFGFGSCNNLNDSNDHMGDEVDIFSENHSSSSFTSTIPRPTTPNPSQQYKINLQTTNLQDNNPESLKSIIIDGSNVAMCHGNNKRYSVRGIAIIIEYFYKRGHREIVAFIPSYRKSKRIENLKPPTQERYLLDQLENLGFIAWTPSRWISGKGRVSAYDDRFIVKYAAEKGGIIVSNDTYKDLLKEAEKSSNGAMKLVIENNLLMFTFVGDIFMPPDDPLGRFGPRLDQFLCR